MLTRKHISIPFNEFEPLLQQLRIRYEASQSAVLELMGYAGRNNVTTWKAEGKVPLLAVNAAKWLLAEAGGKTSEPPHWAKRLSAIKRHWLDAKAEDGFQYWPHRSASDDISFLLSRLDTARAAACATILALREPSGEILSAIIDGMVRADPFFMWMLDEREAKKLGRAAWIAGIDRALAAPQSGGEG